jgi:16S rRNA processing protein RimM
MSEEKIIVGQINGIYGVKGEVKVFSHTDPRANILNYSPWLLNIKGEWQAFDVLQSQVLQGGKSIVALLEGILDRDIAKQFMGVEIAILSSQLVATDGFYWRDLIGCEVFNQDNVLLGTVQELVETGAHDVLRIRNAQTDSSILIPYVFEEYIQEVDIDSKKIKVHWDLSDNDEL